MITAIKRMPVNPKEIYRDYKRGDVVRLVTKDRFGTVLMNNKRSVTVQIFRPVNWGIHKPTRETQKWVHMMTHLHIRQPPDDQDN